MADYDITPTRDRDVQASEPASEPRRTPDTAATVLAVPGIALGTALTARREPDGGGTDPLGDSVADPAITATLREQAGRGAALPPKVADEFGKKFGADLSSVRVHHDAVAANLADSLQASAFTYGPDIYFSRGAYNPDSDQGRRLVAHELAHVVQQRGAPGTGDVMIGRANDPAESQADQLADSALRDLTGTDTEQPASAGPANLQRLTIIPEESEDEQADTDTDTTNIEATDAEAGADAGDVAESGEEEFGIPTVPNLEHFASYVDRPAPSYEDVADVRLAGIEEILEALSEQDKATLGDDEELLQKARVFVGESHEERLIDLLAHHLPDPLTSGEVVPEPEPNPSEPQPPTPSVDPADIVAGPPAPSTGMAPAEEFADLIRTAAERPAAAQPAAKPAAKPAARPAERPADPEALLARLQSVLKRIPRAQRVMLWSNRPLMDSALKVLGPKSFGTLAVAMHAAEATTNPFAIAVGGGQPPASEQDAAARIRQLVEIVRPMPKQARAALLDDGELMQLTMSYVGREQFGNVVTLLSSGPRLGQPLDVLIRHYLGMFNPLVRPFADVAAGQGRRPAGEPTVISPPAWSRVAAVNQADVARAQAESAEPGEAGTPAKMDPKAAGTAIRDGIREYSDPGFAMAYGPDVADTVAEYFTRKVLRHPDLQRAATLDPYDRQDVFDWFNQSFMQVLGPNRERQEVVLAEAYFGGKVDLLEQQFLAFRTQVHGETTDMAVARFQQLFRDIADGYWSDADEVCRP